MKVSKRGKKNISSIFRGLVVLLAYALDCIGEPSVAWHPVVWYGKLIHFLEQRAPRGAKAQLGYGAIMLLVANASVLIPVLLVQLLVQGTARAIRRHEGELYAGIFYAGIEGACLKPFFALRMLADSGAQVRGYLERNDSAMARQALQSLVSRERSQLDARLIAAAAIESLAENLNDSIVAPLFFYALFGLPGAACYRLCNTFDSMIGYHGRYEYLGKPAARLDDLLNWLPARLTALLISICAPLYDGSIAGAWRIWLRDGRKTESPNAGQPMAAAAGALGVQLEKVGHYTLGDHKKKLLRAIYDVPNAWCASLEVWRLC